MLIPRPAGIFQRLANVFVGSLSQVNDLRINNPIRELAYVSLQFSVHRLEAAEKKFRVLVRWIDLEPWIGASGGINDEVGEGLVEWSNRPVDVILENEE